MINLTFKIDDISNVIKVYNQIQVQWSTDRDGTFTAVSGTDFPINLESDQSTYTAQDPYGTASTWYQARYICDASGSLQACVLAERSGEYSNWSDPILGETGIICCAPTYPSEFVQDANQLVIDRIRRLIGDPIGLKREFNERDNIHPDGKIYELEEKGWPCSISINGETGPYNAISEVPVNNYRYLQFSFDITEDTGSGVPDVDVMYYTFRNSDREIWELYDTDYPPAPLTIDNATSEVYMLQTAIILLRQELIEDSVEDGATITDEASRYSPDGGLRVREAIIDQLQKRLDRVIDSLSMVSITGVLLD